MHISPAHTRLRTICRSDATVVRGPNLNMAVAQHYHIDLSSSILMSMRYETFLVAHYSNDTIIAHHTGAAHSIRS